MPLSEPKYHEILLRLADAGVEAIVVGMAAAVIQGAHGAIRGPRATVSGEGGIAETPTLACQRARA